MIPVSFFFLLVSNSNCESSSYSYYVFWCSRRVGPQVTCRCGKTMCYVCRQPIAPNYQHFCQVLPILYLLQSKAESICLSSPFVPFLAVFWLYNSITQVILTFLEHMVWVSWFWRLALWLTLIYVLTSLRIWGWFCIFSDCEFSPLREWYLATADLKWHSAIGFIHWMDKWIQVYQSCIYFCSLEEEKIVNCQVNDVSNWDLLLWFV